MLHRARLAALAIALVTACAAVPEEGKELGATESELTTTTLVPSTSMVQGTSKSGSYTAPVSGTLTFRTSGTGDVDLYVRKGAAASRTTYDCKSDGSTAAEQCQVTVTAGQVVYYYVYAYSAATASLVVDVPDAAPPPGGTTTIELFPTTSIAQGASKTGSYTATVAGEITFATTGTGDVDLYIKKGAAASRSVYDCKSEGGAASEQCKMTIAVGDKVYYYVYGYSAGSARLTVAIPSSTSPTTTTVTLFPPTAIARGTSKTGMFTAPAAGEHVFRTTGTGDADLYVKKGAAASSSSYDCKSDGSTATEECRVTAAVGDKLYYSVYGYSDATASLTVTFPGSAAAPVALPPGFVYCPAGSACAGASIRADACAEGVTTCAPARTTTVAWSVNGAPVGSMAVLVSGTSSGVTPVVRQGSAYVYSGFVIANAASKMVLGSDLGLTLSYYGLAPVWGGTTRLDWTGSTVSAANGTSSFYAHPSYDPGVTHAALVSKLEEIVAAELAITKVTVPPYQAFLMPTDLAIVLGGEGNWSFGDGTVAVNYGNPPFIANQGGVAKIVAHEFSHEFTHTQFAQIAGKFGGNNACLNEGLADALGNFLGYVPDSDFGTAQDGTDFSRGCTAQTENHAKGNCVFWNLKRAGYFRADMFTKLFAPQHTFNFDSCTATNAATGNSWVVYLTEATGSDMSAFVTGIGVPNAGSYAAAKAALGF